MQMNYFTLQAIFLPLLPLLTIIYIIFYRRQWHPNRSPVGLAPPSPRRLPIIGHLHLLSDMPHHTFTKLAEKLGPMFYLRLGQVPTIVVSSAPFARLILKTHDHVFSTRPRLISAQYLSFNCSDVTFSPYGPYWRQARKICVTELLSSKRVSSFQLVRDEEVNRLLTVLSTRSGLEINVSELFFSLSNDILCRVAFGRRFTQGEGSEGQKRHLSRVLTETQDLFSGLCIGDFFPDWKWVHSVSGYKKRLTKNLAELTMVCEEIIEEHRNSRDDEKEIRNKEDFVDVLLRVQKRDDLEVPITDDNLKALVLDMFVAGTDSSTATLEWAMTELARHPEVMKRAQEEVRSIAGKTGKVEESHLQHLLYIKAVIKETMRLHPSVPLLVPRESMDECILDGYKIPAKTRVLINNYAIGRDPNSWENPLEYNPKRFEDADVDFKDPDSRFLPFGGGRRVCPGYNFALAMVEIALARLLFHFDWALPQGISRDAVDLTESFGLATRKRNPLVLVPTVNEGLMAK